MSIHDVLVFFLKFGTLLRKVVQALHGGASRPQDTNIIQGTNRKNDEKKYPLKGDCSYDYFEWPGMKEENSALSDLKEKSPFFSILQNKNRLTDDGMKSALAYNNQVYRFSNHMFNPLKVLYKHTGIKRFAPEPTTNKTVALKLSVIDSPALEINCFQAVRRVVHIGPRTYTQLEGPNCEVYHDLNFISAEKKIEITQGEADIWYLSQPSFDRMTDVSSYTRLSDTSPQAWTHTAGVYAIAAVTLDNSGAQPPVDSAADSEPNIMLSIDSPEALFEIRPKKSNKDGKAGVIMAAPTLAIFGVENPGPENGKKGIYNDSLEAYNQNNTDYNPKSVYAKNKTKDIHGCWDEFLPKKEIEPTSQIYQDIDKSGTFGIFGGYKAYNGTPGIEIYGRSLRIAGGVFNSKINNWSSNLSLDKGSINLLRLEKNNEFMDAGLHSGLIIDDARVWLGCKREKNKPTQHITVDDNSISIDVEGSSVAKLEKNKIELSIKGASGAKTGIVIKEGIIEMVVNGKVHTFFTPNGLVASDK